MQSFSEIIYLLDAQDRNYLGETNLRHGIQPLDYIICVSEVETSCLKWKLAETRGRAVRNKIPQLSRTAGRFINTDSENSTFAGKKSEVFYIYIYAYIDCLWQIISPKCKPRYKAKSPPTPSFNHCSRVKAVSQVRPVWINFLLIFSQYLHVYIFPF